MRDSGKPDRPALDDIACTGLLIDALAERTQVEAVADPADAALADLLGQWRDDLRWPPASALVSESEAVSALRAGLVDEPKGGRRGLAAVGSAAAALLLVSGFGAMVVEARPGDALYGLHAMFFDQPNVNDDQVMLSAQAHLAKAQQLIDHGDFDQAQSVLDEASNTLQSVDNERRQRLLDEVDQLNTKLGTHGPGPHGPVPKKSPVPPGHQQPANQSPVPPIVGSRPALSGGSGPAVPVPGSAGESGAHPSLPVAPPPTAVPGPAQGPGMPTNRPPGS